MKYSKGSKEMVDLVKKIIGEFHKDRLGGAKIAVLTSDKTRKNKGRTIYGWATRPPKALIPLLDDVYDFILCFPSQEWETLNDLQKKALVDHELCHCTFNIEHEPQMIGHDYEEFSDVIHRHGFVWESAAEHIIQGKLLEQDVTVKAPDLKKSA